jgi:CBS domain-containing membrane protein
MTTPLSWLKSFWPAPVAASIREQIRGCIGVTVGLLATALISRLVLGPGVATAQLLAPMGASAVLLYAIPASPLAQPWSILGGTLVAGFVGVTCHLLIPDMFVASALAVGLAVAAMFALRCVHPPSGAVALTVVLGSPAIHALGYSFLLVPLGLNSVLLLGCALIFNNATRHRYPHLPASNRPPVQPSGDLAPFDRLAVHPADLDSLLAHQPELLDISRDDLEDLFAKLDRLTYRRRFGVLTCGDVMSSTVIAVSRRTSLAAGWDLMLKHQLQAMPVLAEKSRQVIGQVHLLDFIRHGHPGNTTVATDTIDDIMKVKFPTVFADTPMVDLVPLLAGEYYFVPVIDSGQRMLGMVTRPDLLAALYHGNLADIVVPHGCPSPQLA